jgi:sialate O-acetylesterase
MKFPGIVVAAIFLFTPPLLADVSLPSIFSDHMVLQQGESANVWGHAAPGEKVTITAGDQTITTEARPDGRWAVKLTKLSPQGPMELTIAGKNTIRISDVLIGEVWLCSGQSNMDFRIAKSKERPWCGVKNEQEEIANANHPQIRMFIADVVMKDEEQFDVPGKWLVCSPETLGEFSAVAYFFGRDLHQALGVPIGLVLSTYGGSTAQAWMSREAIEKNPDIASMLDGYAKSKTDWDSGESMKKFEAAQKTYEEDSARAKQESKPAPRAPRKPGDPRKDQHSPCVLYNGMLRPLAPYTVKGAIWYQGESNGYNADQYLTTMKSLIANWRDIWQNGNLPFLFVQLANYRGPATQPVQENSEIARVRDAQLKTLAIPHTGMASAVDIGEEKDIHPRNKLDVGKRLAMTAKNLVYGMDVASSGPLYRSFDKPSPASIRVHFTSTDGGLVAKDGKLTGFALKDASGRWFSADARIEGETILLSSPEVTDAIAARYAWANNPPITLYNGAGLPASPFRTDE